MADELLRLEGLSKYYTSAHGVVMGLSNVSLTFRRGEFVAVTGESGSGKTTLARCIGGSLSYESGEMYVDGKPTSHFDGGDYERYRAQYISFISQNYGILEGCSVLRNVLSALRFAGLEGKEAQTRAEEILRKVSLYDLRHRRAGKLSSGQKQRLSIARALAKPAPILIADEPTGNLDPENSRVVMELLAQAAQERLVILITHDFSEAAELATRHIAIRDGQVVMDLPLREASVPSQPMPARVSATKSHGAFVAGLQLRGRPVWVALVLLFFTLTAFGVFAFLGTFLVNLDDTDTRVYDNSAFRNGARERIVVVRMDGGAMEQRDYDAMLSVPHVQALEKWGYVTDVNYAWREGVDYDVKFDVESQGDMFNSITFLTEWISVRASAPFLRTVPALSGGREFLTAGRQPENLYEVVAAGNESLLGQTITVYLQNRDSWSEAVKVPMTVEVVGITDYGTGLYFHEDLGRAFNHCYMEYDWFFLYDETLPDDRVRVSESRQTAMKRYMETMVYLPDLSVLPDAQGEHSYVELTLADEENGGSPTHQVGLLYHMLFSRDTFYRVTIGGNSDQVSLTIEDYAYTDEVLSSLKQLGYIAVSPFREGSAKTDPKLAQQRVQTLLVCAGALAAVLVLQLLVLRALMSAQTANYRLLADMGMNRKTMLASIHAQLLSLALLGAGLGMGAAWLCAAGGVERIDAIVRYLPWWQALLLLPVHFAAALAATVWIARRETRLVFPQSAKTFDLPGAREVDA